MSAAAHTISLQEFIARPDRDDSQREELMEGELIVSPGSKALHAAIVRALRLQLTLLEQRGYIVSNDFSCILGDCSMPIPDLAVVEEQRWSRAIADDGWLIGSPELAIEVSSPSNRKLQLKAALYVEHGAEQVWVVYPERKTVVIVTATSTTEARLGDAPQFHGVTGPLDSIFPR